jgi:hypothetical protein
VGRHLPGGVEVTVRRGADGRVPGRPERFILADGTALESRPERLRAAPAVVRAVSFAVP